MAHENEDDDDEIERHLIRRIELAITSLSDADREKYPVIKEINSVIDILKRNTSTNQKVAKEDWPGLRRENLYYLNNLFTEWQMNKGKDISDVLKKMKKELAGEQEGSARGQGGAVSDQPHDHGQVPRHITYERHKGAVYRWSSRHGPRKVHGLEHIVLALERDLVMRKVDDSFKVFGITGVAGIGKTTLCQQVFNRESVKRHFCPRIWVCLSKQPRDRDEYEEEVVKQPRDRDKYYEEVVVRILKCLGIEDEIINNAANGSDGLKRLILLLRLQLIGKRYLLVLDDAWHDVKDDRFFSNLTQKEQLDENWGHELGYALPKGCGGTIICSSRSQMLLKRMLGKEASLTVLKRQTEDIIDVIFQDNVKGYDEDEREFPQHLTDLKKEILKKCDGIPLAAILLAKIAREGLSVKGSPSPAVPGGGHEIKQAPASTDGVPRAA